MAVDATPQLARRLRRAAVDRSREDLADEDQIPALAAAADPVLADLWDNARDARYDD